MDSLRYKGYASENLPQIPNAVDLSTTLKKRNEEYIESLKFLRDYAAQQDSAMIKDFEEQQEKFRQSQKTASDQYLRQKETVLRQKTQKYQNIQNQKRQQAGASKEANVENVLKDLAKFSTTAASAIQDWSEKKIETDKAYGQMVAAQNPYNPTVVGVDQQSRDLKIAGSYIEAQAAQLDLQGRSDEADQLRGLSGWRKIAYKPNYG